jgi:XTP/dITP diphosphohydrolase
MKEVIYATANKSKFEVLKLALEPFDIELIQKETDLPEIQSADIKEVAKDTVLCAFKEIGKPVITTDVSCLIKALNGFPGSFIKYVNKYLIAEDYLRLMSGKTDRSIVFQEAVACCKPNQEPKVFLRETRGIMAESAGPKSDYAPINEIFIPDGYDKVASAIDEKEIQIFWAGGEGREVFWKQIAEYFLKVRTRIRTFKS